MKIIEINHSYIDSLNVEKLYKDYKENRSDYILMNLKCNDFFSKDTHRLDGTSFRSKIDDRSCWELRFIKPFNSNCDIDKFAVTLYMYNDDSVLSFYTKEIESKDWKDDDLITWLYSIKEHYSFSKNVNKSVALGYMIFYFLKIIDMLSKDHRKS